jgi:hypothetical protein
MIKKKRGQPDLAEQIKKQGSPNLGFWKFTRGND